MSFNDAENSIALGKPNRLYLFERGTNQWAYVNGPRDITWDSVDYVATAISDSGIRLSGDIAANELNIEAPYDLAIAQLYRGTPPSDEILVTIRDYQVDEDDALVAWIGSIYAVGFPGLNASRISCQSLQASMTTPGLRLSWSKQCQHVLYGRGCNLTKGDFAVAATITDLDGASITAAELDVSDDGFFDGGFIEWSLPGSVTERRTILNHAGDTVDVFGGTDGLAVDDNITVYPGCPRTIDVCESRFSNSVNYGGVPGMPGRNPFDGNPLY